MEQRCLTTLLRDHLHNQAMTEVWQPVPGWEGFYEVSDLGRVRSIPRQFEQRHASGKIYSRFAKGGLLTLCKNPNGYKIVCLKRRGKNETATVHRLVMLAFKAHEWRPGLEVCHGPAGISDNSLQNLSWGTHKQNNGPDKARDGTLTLGSRNGMAKLTEQQVTEIKALIAQQSLPKAAIARQFSVSPSLIDQIAWGKTWAHVA